MPEHELPEARLELAQIAYEAYGENRNWRTYDDKSMPQWTELKPEIQNAWAAAAQAVASEYGD